MKRHDSLLAHCIARAVRERVGAELDPEQVTTWLAVKVTPGASRVCAFIVEWTLALDELGTGQTHAAIQRWMSDSPATFFRRLAAFRELWPEYDDPEELAVLLRQAVRDRRELRNRGADVELALPATAAA